MLNARTKLHSSLFPICENDKRKGQTHLNKNHNIYIAKDSRSVIERPGISRGYYERGPQLLSYEKKTWKLQKLLKLNSSFNFSIYFIYMATAQGCQWGLVAGQIHRLISQP